MDIQTALDQFIQQYTNAHKQQNQPMVVQYDNQWLSPCHTEQGGQGDWLDWRPVRRQENASLRDLEQALQLKIDPQLSEYFCRYWSDNLNAKAPKGNLQLLLPWNQDDFVRLQQNLVGHVLMKRRLGQPITLFFAVTDEEDFIISIDNATGKVMLEQVGVEPTEVLAEDLAGFISSLQPRLA